MITYPRDKEYLNLQQQVQKNKEDIATHYQIDRTLADYGIRIIGFYNTIEDAKEDLGDPYDGPYGNAVGIGFQAPYTFYIWTRANNISEFDYWQDVGQLAVVGPQGPQGEPGEQGPAGENAKIFTGRGVPTVSLVDYSIYIDGRTGDVYKPEHGEWTLFGNIRGPQGLPGLQGQTGQRGPKGFTGDKGDKGDPGGFIKIARILVDAGELPNPTVLQDLEIAYLVGATEPYDLWMQIGPNYDEAVWYNLGPLNVATFVSVNGEYQNIWDADTKLDKVSNDTGENLLYTVDDVGEQTMIATMVSPDAYTVPMRDGEGHIEVPLYPDLAEHATSKQYVDGLIVDSPTITTMWEGPDLSLNLSADIVAQIQKAITIPTNPSSAKTLPIYDRATGNVAWMGTTSFVATANGPKYQIKGSTWTPTMTQGQTLELFSTNEAIPSFNITVTKLDNRQSTITDITYAKIACANSGWIHIMAYGSTALKAHMYVKAIDSITQCLVFAQKYASGIIT